MRRRSRLAQKKPIIEDSSSDSDEAPSKKQCTSGTSQIPSNSTNDNPKDYSSSESDIESYLQKPNKIDLSSSFFNTQKSEFEFHNIEKNIFQGVTRLSDSSESEIDSEEKLNEVGMTAKLAVQENSNLANTNSNLNFQQLENFTRKLEEAKKHVENYNKKKIKSKTSTKLSEKSADLDISDLLAIGESKQLNLDNIKEDDLHSSDFETSEDDWEEVKVKEIQEVKEKIPKEGLQITVGVMPEHCKKKKGVDLLAAMKRRLNRIRKENQAYVHKVHLLCWLAHGNYVNSVINDSGVLASALSLLPSNNCFPSDRTDLNYLEQIVNWYKKAIHLEQKSTSKQVHLTEALQQQISKKIALDYKLYVYIFIAILRALGIPCRLVISFQAEPLRPPVSELHSLAKEKSNVLKKDRKVLSVASTSKNKSTKQSNSILKNVHSKTNSTNNKKKMIPTTPKVNNMNAGKIKHKKVDSNEKKKRDTKETKQSIKKINAKVETMTNGDNKPRNTQTGSSVITEIKTRDILKKGTKNENGLKVDSSNKTRSKSSSETKRNSNKKSRSKSTSDIIKIKLPNRKSKSKNLPQIDGICDSNDESYYTLLDSIIQLDGNNDDSGLTKLKKTKNSNLKKLKYIDGKSNITEEKNLKKKTSSIHKETPEQLNSTNNFPIKKRLSVSKPNLEKLKSEENSNIIKESKINNSRKLLRKLSSTNSPIDKQLNNSDYLQNRNSEDEFETSFSRSPIKKILPHMINKASPSQSPVKRTLNVKNDIISLIKGRILEQKHIDRSRMVKKRKPIYNNSDSDSDYMPEPIKKKHHDSDSDIEYFVPKLKVKRRIPVKKEELGKKIISSESDLDESGKKKRKGVNVWVEVFLEAEEKWITADIVKGQVHCISEIYSRTTHPVTYVVAWSHDNRIKDVTRRYCKNFSSITRKLRVDTKWWEETLRPFTGQQNARDKEEDDDLNRQQLDQPMPKSIAEYKNHPLYALRRHLLKFEAIYPSDLTPLGFIRGEAVYPRNCVYICKSRDIWLKEALVVKPGEKPYKIVKARPKYDKLSNQVITDQMLEIFGPWQTTDYEPPTAENGIVPRNAFGNVELFKSCMLPKGTVHLKLPGLNKVCRKMNVDCASAIVGFDFHGGWSHPVYDGFVVCEEFADQVAAAWEIEQDEIERKENEKIEKRVYGNWKRLIRGLLIRERLKAKYKFEDVPSTSGHKKKKVKVQKKKPQSSDDDSDRSEFC